MKIDENILERARLWTGKNFDKETRKQVEHLIQNNPTELTEAFYRDLEFGTGGLRGIMGVGTNRMNKYTVGMATQGLANYVMKMFPGETPKAAIAFDCRDNSEYFAQITAEIFSANGFEVYLFESLRPTPLLSFTIRHYGCHTGVIITASHNPKEYNGYKVYWNDGAQLVAPHDTHVIEEVQNITDVTAINFDKNPDLIKVIGEETDRIYIEKLSTLSLAPDIIQKHKDLKIVFTPIHGASVKVVPDLLKAFGFENIYHVPEQDIPRGDFPTVVSPNPEEPEALTMAIAKAKEVDADLVMATDPDGDRVGIAVRDHDNEFVLLNGNQTASLIIYYLLSQWKAQNKLHGEEYIVKTIVTTGLLKEIAQDFNTPCYDVLTGFKFIADIIRRLEGEKTFIGGGEESYGYLVGDMVRDKDATISCAIIAEAMAWAREKDKTLYELLIEIYVKYGLYKEKLISITRKGKAGMEEINSMMDKFRNQPPAEVDGSKLIIIKDYQLSVEKDLRTSTETLIELPKSNVIQFFLEDGSIITMRPSGTEPKIKFYFGVNEKLKQKEDYETLARSLNDKLDRLAKDIQNV